MTKIENIKMYAESIIKTADKKSLQPMTQAASMYWAGKITACEEILDWIEWKEREE